MATRMGKKTKNKSVKTAPTLDQLLLSFSCVVSPPGFQRCQVNFISVACFLINLIITVNEYRFNQYKMIWRGW